MVAGIVTGREYVIVCPVCGSPRSLRARDGKRQCSVCYTEYELPKPAPRYRRKKTVVQQATPTVESAIEEEGEEGEE